ncbi:hypothetical protein QJQ45_029173 [Haematococcus lacustris]|nr:hypothetical protein QJQ45_029173 [Haematococcus lacustris]
MNWWPEAFPCRAAYAAVGLATRDYIPGVGNVVPYNNPEATQLRQNFVASYTEIRAPDRLTFAGPMAGVTCDFPEFAVSTLFLTQRSSCWRRKLSMPSTRLVET